MLHRLLCRFGFHLWLPGIPPADALDCRVCRCCSHREILVEDCEWSSVAWVKE